MRIFLFVFLSASIVLAQKGFTPEYFVKKHNLKLPEVDIDKIDVSKYTHRNDSWLYFYKGQSRKVDSTYRYLNIEGFPPNKQYEKYTYKGDSTFVRQIAIAQDNLDTTNNYEIAITNNGQAEKSFNKTRNYCNFVTYTSWGCLKSEKFLNPGDKEPHGHECSLVKIGDYIESIETRENKVDSSDIQRYYFSAFDSLVAQYTLSKKEDPALMNLIFYTNTHKKKIEYDFDFFKHSNEVTTFDIYTYRPNGNLFRMYLFDSKAHRPSKGGSKPPREYKLLSYVEYSYDSLGRKTSMISYDPPDAGTGK